MNIGHCLRKYYQNNINQENPIKMDDSKNKYQCEFSEMHRSAMYNRRDRERKAKTMVSVLRDYFNTDLKLFNLLDVGSSTGLIANYLAMYFGEVVGIDTYLHFSLM